VRNLEKRGGRYFFRVVIDGRKIREDVGANAVEARRRAALLRDRYRARKRRGSLLSVQDFAGRWLREYVAQARNAEGRALAGARLERYILPALGSMLLEDVQPEHLRGLRGRLEASGRPLSPQTVRHVLSDARCLFRYAVEVGVLVASPFRGRLMPRVEERAPRAYSEAQVGEIVAVAGPYAFLVRLAVLTGLRWGELHRLTWHQVQELPEPHLVVERTKSGKVRRVPLGAEARALLEVERRRRGSVYVYAPRHEKPAQVVRYLRGRVDFPVTFHALRHTFARRWVESGASLAVLQEILGHSGIGVTQRYARLTEAAVFAESKRILG